MPSLPYIFLKKEKEEEKEMVMPWSKVSRDRREPVVIVGLRRGVARNV